MDIFRQHEVFEIETLDALHRAGVLEPLVFGGGTMLRLCHELPRYSADLDFWFIKTVEEDVYFKRMQGLLGEKYEITDAWIKHHTLLLELRHSAHPRRLKIEIRRKMKPCDYQEKIAFSRFSARQVVLKAHTLEQAMKNKVAALLDRTEIRDAFDIEFLLRRGVPLPELDAAALRRLRAGLDLFKDRDFAVTLGSILENDMRDYYVSQKFAFLTEKISMALAAPKMGSNLDL